jgi:hypothetical protein
MLSTAQEYLEPKTAGFESPLEALFKDLSLFVPLCIAWLIVQRGLRRERKERVARLKLIKLVPRIGHEHSTD